MDNTRFDNVTRAFAMSRRGVLRNLLAAALAGAGGLAGANAAEGQGCATLRRRCSADGDCCSDLCDPMSGRCVCGPGTEECGRDCLPIDQYLTDVDNCGGCRDRCRRADECQMPACIDGVCGSLPDPDQVGWTCGRGGEVCGADGACTCPPEQPTACRRGCVDTGTDLHNCGACDIRCPRMPNSSAVCEGGVCGIVCDGGAPFCGDRCCPDPRDCCDGNCCPLGECCGIDGECSLEACQPHCEIGGVVYVDGALNPDNACQVCDFHRDVFAWSFLSDDTPCGDGQVCCDGRCCAPGQCCTLGLCGFCGCLIGDVDVAEGALNPDNACEICNPILDPFSWSSRSDESCGDHQTCCAGACCGVGECCNVSGACEPCRCVIGGLVFDPGDIGFSDCEFCDPNRSTTDWSPVSDFTDCGTTPGRVCCNGGCCSPTECCTPTGCEECGPVCRIGEQDVLEGEVNPDDPCQLCDPDRHSTDWSEAPDDFVCGGGLDDEQVCCRGLCCDPGECCDDGCKPSRCRIVGFNWDAGTRNPLNTCEICDPARDRENWSPAPNGPGCGAGDDRECCEGMCCPQGECCNDVGECEPCPCQINGQDIVDGGVNPSNTCQICDVDQNREDWMVLGDEDACGGADDDRICCGGNCCPQGECCEGGTCQPCGCEIDGDPVAPDSINDDNPCQVCDPSRARLAWSPVDNGAPCSSDGAECCGGECCAANECCILDACGPCLCQIGNDTHAAGTPNPDNPCEVCDPDSDPFNWSPASDGTSCGVDQECCAGACCQPGECCNLGVCQFCGCLIGEEEVGEGTLNPDNECEICNPVLDPIAWSPRSDEPCGDDQVCCGGICCEAGQCCGLSDACEACSCDIDGQLVDTGTVNPANDCEVCTPSISVTSWSPASGNAPCGDNPDRVCCRGVCCTDGNCCHSLDETCGPAPCHCTIGEDEFPEGERNPANPCEHCDPTEDAGAWTTVPDDSPCGEMGDQVCCVGTCCASSECCTLGVCGLCGCLIEGQGYAEGAVNPENPCQVCDPVVDPFAWSPVDNDTSCGLVQVCCDGECCGPNECCGAGGSCEDCAPDCVIGGVPYQAGAVNPNNDCEVCDPARDRFSWSTKPDNTICGESDDQVCCDGVCCIPNWCCTAGHCDNEFCEDPCVVDPDSCPCEIDGVVYPFGNENPANECQYCEWHVSQTSWTDRDSGEPCGISRNQVCCAGACCAPDMCCAGDEVCAPEGSPECEDGCVIDGVVHPNFTVNPANLCQHCDISLSTTEWSSATNNTRCGERLNRFCCQGACCEPGACCNGANVCELGGSSVCDGCVIDGDFYLDRTRNPANTTCQICATNFSTTEWTTICRSDCCATLPCGHCP